MTQKASRTKKVAIVIVATLVFSSGVSPVVKYKAPESIIESKRVARKHFMDMTKRYRASVERVFEEPVAQAAFGPYPQFFFES